MPKKTICKYSWLFSSRVISVTRCSKNFFQVLLIPYLMDSSLRRSLSCRVPLSWCQTSPWHRWGISTSSCEPVWMRYVGCLVVWRCGLDALVEKGHWEKGTFRANAFYLHLIRHPFSLRLTEIDLGMNCRPGSAPLLVGGDSAGGGTAVSLILRLKQGAGWTPQGAKGEGTWDECTHILPPLYFLLGFNWCFNPKWWSGARSWSSTSSLISGGISVFSERCIYTVSFDDRTSVDECGTLARFSNYIHTFTFAS